MGIGMGIGIGKDTGIGMGIGIDQDKKAARLWRLLILQQVVATERIDHSVLLCGDKRFLYLTFQSFLPFVLDVPEGGGVQSGWVEECSVDLVRPGGLGI